jgi:hypothetical protein
VPIDARSRIIAELTVHVLQEAPQRLLTVNLVGGHVSSFLMFA